MRKQVRVNRRSLAAVGVKLVDRGRIDLECESCGRLWGFERGIEDRLPRNWAKCARCYPDVGRALAHRTLPAFNNPFRRLRQVWKAA